MDIVKSKRELLGLLGKVKVKGGGIEDLKPLARIAAPSDVTIEYTPTDSEIEALAETLDLEDIANIYLNALTEGEVNDLSTVDDWDGTAATHEDGWYQTDPTTFAALDDPAVSDNHEIEAEIGTVVVVFKYTNTTDNNNDDNNDNDQSESTPE